MWQDLCAFWLLPSARRGWTRRRRARRGRLEDPVPVSPSGTGLGRTGAGVAFRHGARSRTRVRRGTGLACATARRPTGRRVSRFGGAPARRNEGVQARTRTMRSWRLHPFWASFRMKRGTSTSIQQNMFDPIEQYARKAYRSACILPAIGPRGPRHRHTAGAGHRPGSSTAASG